MTKGIVWNAMWRKFEKERRGDGVFVSVRPQYSRSTVVFDRVRNRIEANINTHRAIYLSQSENGEITGEQLLQRLEGKKRFKVTGDLATVDARPGVATGRVHHGKHEYEVVFTGRPFHNEMTPDVFATGGILTVPLAVEGHRVLEADLLCAAGLVVEADATLEVVEGRTLIFSEAVVRGSLKGYLTGVLRVVEQGEVNGNLLAGEVVLSGRPTLIGMYYGDLITIEDDCVALWKEFGSMTNAIDAGSNVTLRFQDAEPLVLTMDPNTWTVNGGSSGGEAGFVGTNTTGDSWYLSNSVTPVDLLGRRWSPELEDNGVLMPAMTNIGVMKLEKDLQLEVVDDTEHNFALFMMNQHPITHIRGAIHIHVIEGVACPPEDIEALEVSSVEGEGTSDAPFVLQYGLRDSRYIFRSAESIAVQAGTKASVMKRFPDIDQFGWQFAPNPVAGGYTWYGYPKGALQEHWNGPTGDERYIVHARARA